MFSNSLHMPPEGFVLVNFKLRYSVQPSSLVALQDWVSRNDLQRFEILLCIGNKVDLVPGHPVHSEYRRHLLKDEDSFADSRLEFVDYGISQTEGSSLLGDDEPSSEIRRSCLEWSAEHNIEFIESCACNPDFDQCKALLPSCLDLLSYAFSL